MEKKNNLKVKSIAIFLNVFFGLIVVFALARGCQNILVKMDAKTGNQKVKTDTVTKEIPIYISGKIKPQFTLVGSQSDTVWLKEKIDTMAILKAFFTRNIYDITYSDSIIDLCQTDTTWQNKLYPGLITYNLHYKKRETTITRTIKEIKQPRILLGAGLSSSAFTGLGLQLAAGYANNHGLQFVAATNIAGRQPNLSFILLKPLTYKTIK